MKKLLTDFAFGFRSEAATLLKGVRQRFPSNPHRSKRIWLSAGIAAGACFWSGWAIWEPADLPSRKHAKDVRAPAPEQSFAKQLALPAPIPIPTPDYFNTVREIPKVFRLNTKKPNRAEGAVSGSIADWPFDPKRDLIRVEDSRVWWESEHDDATNDTEDDHLMHWCMEDPFRRLVELVEKEGGHLKVQDAYRAEGVHARKSLHKQGRAIDLTDFNLPLSRVAALAWAAGFDWVYYEAAGGLHVHASVNPTGKIRRTFAEAHARP